MIANGLHAMAQRRTLLFVVNVDWFFISHRLAIAEQALREGYEVHVATTLTGRGEELRERGLVVHALTIARNGTGVRGEWLSLRQIAAVLRKVRPDVVHLVTIKPVLFGGLAARLLGTPAVVAAVPGLGAVFVATGARAAMVRWLILLLYRLALRRPRLVAVFQNEDDRKVIQDATGLPSAQCTLIRGSGVDLARFSAQPWPEHPAQPPVVLLAARLLVDKGVREFVAAARLLRSRGATARFCLAGSRDTESLASITAQELAEWQQAGHVEIWGQRDDMPEVLAMAQLVVLPSYREGFPKVLIEAAACARPIVTTDVPGCRDAIVPEVSGLLVPPRDATALADAIGRLLADPARGRAMGQAGRALAQERYGIESVVAAHLGLYRQLLAAAA